MHKSSVKKSHDHLKCYKAIAVVSDVLERLLREISKDGMVRVEDALHIIKLLNKGTYELDIAFERQAKECTAPARDKVSSRNNPFRRLMVRPFETLLTGDPAVYPRPLLTNYFAVLEQAYGDKFAEYDRHSKGLLQALLVEHGHSLEWDTFYIDPKVKQILIHALRRFLRFLESPPGYQAWQLFMSRTAPTGQRPSAENTDLVRKSLEHTLQGLEMAR
jgi:hypothetical protein